MVEELRPDWKVCGHCSSVHESVDFLKSNTPELILMDIQLNDGICFSIFDQVDVKSMVIFTTAYDNYAINAFKVNSIDYLLKPIKSSDLENALDKFESFKSESSSENIDYNKLLDALRKGSNAYRQRFMISGANSYYKLKTKDIGWFYSENKITFAVDFTGKEHIIEYTLESLEQELDPLEFFRANRSTIISIESVERFEDYFGGKLSVLLTPPFNQRIGVSRLKASAFKQWVGK
jgi:DNA-binding LytR/AlgR family response regulator